MKNMNLLNHSLNFIVVILGVFLAFYIDSYSEKRKEKVELRETITSLIEDLEDDHKTYSDYQIPQNEEQVADLEELISDILELDEPKENQLSVNFEVKNYSPISSTYLSLKSSGKTNLIDDFKIRRELSNYYEILSEESISKGEVQQDFFLYEILPWMIENTNLMDVTSEELRGENTLANRLILYSTLIKNKLEYYKVLEEASMELRKSLDAFLNR